jgi:hypothetical protein
MENVSVFFYWGRAGAIEIDLAATLKFDDLTVKGGSIVAFTGESKLVAAMSFFRRI